MGWIQLPVRQPLNWHNCTYGWVHPPTAGGRIIMTVTGITHSCVGDVLMCIVLMTAPHQHMPGANDTYSVHGRGASRSPGTLCASRGSAGPLLAEGGWSRRSCTMQSIPGACLLPVSLVLLIPPWVSPQMWIHLLAWELLV